MARKRLLPQYVSAFRDRHGKIRYKFRKKGLRPGYINASLGTEEFRERYQELLHPEKVTVQAIQARAAANSIDDLCDRYYHPITRLGPTQVTQNKVMAVIEDFRHGRGDRMVADVRFHHLDAIIAKKQVKSVKRTRSGKREVGGFHAAKKLRKELIRLFHFAKQMGMTDHNPAALTMPLKRPRNEARGGFYAWTEGDIAKYRATHPLGTRERLAMELLLWTDQRRSDVIKMGKAQVRDGRIPVTQEKTGKKLWIAMAPQLIEAIIAMPHDQTSPFCFLITKFGKPFSPAGFGNFFRAACDAAGLTQCTAHGLRKATLRRMAELEMSNKSMKSVSGQENDATLREYIRTANQSKLADSAIQKLSDWEKKCLTSSSGLDIKEAMND